MKDFFYNIALRIIESRKSKEANKKINDEAERQRRAEEWKKHCEIINALKKKYISDLEADYIKNANPKFKVGQPVLLNPYSPGDGWEGSVRSALSHTPFKGPVEVVIDSVHIDSTCLSEAIDNMREQGHLDRIIFEMEYEKFVNIINHRLLCNGNNYQWVMHCYRFHKEGEEKIKWHYPLREDKFVSLYSKEGMAVKKLAKLEAEVEKKKEAAKKAREEYDALEKVFHKKIGITYIER
jgi:hypothetical protein